MIDKIKKKARVRISVIEQPSKNDSDTKIKDFEEHNEENHEEHHEEHENHEEHIEHEEHEEKEDLLENKRLNYPKQEKIPFWILFCSFIIGLTFGAGLIGGIFYYRSKVGKITVTPSSNNNTASEETLEPSPTPQEEEKLDLAKYSVNILNGAGIAGEAGKVEKLLNTYGFTNTNAGNASSYNYQETEVAIKKDLPEELFNEVKKAIEGYLIKEVDNLPSSSSYDIVVTVGKSKS